jgi:hypothetical protein
MLALVVHWFTAPHGGEKLQTLVQHRCPSGEGRLFTEAVELRSALATDP